MLIPLLQYDMNPYDSINFMFVFIVLFSNQTSQSVCFHSAKETKFFLQKGYDVTERRNSLHTFLSSAVFVSKTKILNNNFQEITIRVSNRSDLTNCRDSYIQIRPDKIPALEINIANRHYTK